jgi:thiamine-phosphate pyrophosphorylase
MHLIVISNAEAVANEAAVLNQLFNAGLNCFHLRKPGSSAVKIKELLDGIEPAFYPRIALHQHHELAQAYGISRLHYTEEARKKTMPDTLESQKENGYKLSTSIHDVQLICSLAIFNYIFWGPVFHSLSKPGYQSKITESFRLKNESEKPLVIALGGITPDHLQTVKAMGFDGAAVLGAIWNQPEKALETFRQLQASMPCLFNFKQL